MAEQPVNSFPFPKAADHLPGLSVDCVIFGYAAGELHVLITELATREHIFTLPGGFIRKEESVDRAALRVLFDRTGVGEVYLEEFKVFGAPERSRNSVMSAIIVERSAALGLDPTDFSWLHDRFVSVGYYALVNIHEVVPRPGALDKSAKWYPVTGLPDLFLDHREITLTALVALRRDLDRKLIGFNLLPREFTMRQLQELYEAVYDRRYARANFQKKMLKLNVLERTGKQFTGAAHKAPYLYRFRK